MASEFLSAGIGPLQRDESGPAALGNDDKDLLPSRQPEADDVNVQIVGTCRSDLQGCGTARGLGEMVRPWAKLLIQTVPSGRCITLRVDSGPLHAVRQAWPAQPQ
jgi:hypothetical protein